MPALLPRLLAGTCPPPWSRAVPPVSSTRISGAWNRWPATTKPMEPLHNHQRSRSRYKHELRGILR